MPIHRFTVACILAIFVWSSVLLAADSIRYRITVKCDHAGRNVPVCVDLSAPASLGEKSYTELKSSDGQTIVGQVTPPRMLAQPIELQPSEVHKQLNFILPEVLAGKELTFEATVGLDSPKSAEEFAWVNDDHGQLDLKFAGRPLLRYMHAPLDESSKQKRDETFKVFHHVFDPQGKTLLTKGPGGLFPHHRGLFFGFNRITYGNGKKADVWHCTGDAYQSHDAITASCAGPVLGRHVVTVGWHGEKKETFATEQRELTVYRQPVVDGKPVGTLIEFASRVKTSGGDIQLDGDPQHAGFHFRATQEVPDKAKAETYYIRTDGAGKPGEFRNWPDRKDQVDFPWKGLSVVVGGQRYTIANLDRPTNPKPARFSERDYGRFGSYFSYKITPEKPLMVNYRIWVQEGEMTPEQVAAMDADFVDPPKATATRL